MRSLDPDRRSRSRPAIPSRELRRAEPEHDDGMDEDARFRASVGEDELFHRVERVGQLLELVTEAGRLGFASMWWGFFGAQASTPAPCTCSSGLAPDSATSTSSNSTG